MTEQAAYRVLTHPEGVAVSIVADRLVPGAAGAGAVDYIDRIAAAMAADDLRNLRASVSKLASAVADDRSFDAAAGSPEFMQLRQLVIEAFYGDYGPQGSAGTGHERIDFRPPQAIRLRKDWSFLDERPRP